MNMYLCTIQLNAEKNLVGCIPGYKPYLKWSGNERRVRGKGEQGKKGENFTTKQLHEHLMPTC